MVLNTYGRYIWLLYTIIQAKEITYEEISRRWQRSALNSGTELPHRTFQAHLRKIESIFQLTIQCRRTVRGYVYSVADFENLSKNSLKLWLANTMSVYVLLKESENISGRILFEDMITGSRFFSHVVDAMKSGHRLKLECCSKVECTLRSYVVSPYWLKEYKRKWYLLCFCDELNGIRFFPLDEILEMEILPSTFIFPENLSPENRQRDIGLCFDGTSLVQQLRIRVYGDYVDIVRSFPLSPAQNEVYTHEDYSDFEFKECLSDDFLNEIILRSPMIEILEPQSLREKIKNRFKEISDRYDK